MPSMLQAKMMPQIPQILIFAGCLSTASEFTISFDDVPPGHMTFRPVVSKCANGGTAYVGIANPDELLHPNKLYIEFMGGAVCIDKESCEYSGLKMWTDLRYLMVDESGMLPHLFDAMTGGVPIMIDMFNSFHGSFLPEKNTIGHPLQGWRGIFVPTCTADVHVGGVDVNYSGKMVYHHGGVAVREVITALQQLELNVSDFAIYGGSGGGLATAAWMTKVADSFPHANIKALVDSAFHMIPGAHSFLSFYENVSWSPGFRDLFPAHADIKKAYFDEYNLPDFDWQQLLSIADSLKRYAGRLKLAYVACDEDSIVYSDSEKVRKFDTFSGNTYDQRRYQKRDLWAFLTATQKCSPSGTLFSWVAQCTKHHITLRVHMALRVQAPVEVSIPGAISLETFVVNFLAGRSLDAADEDRHYFWFDNHSALMQNVTCPQGESHSSEESNGDNVAVGSSNEPNVDNITAGWSNKSAVENVAAASSNIVNFSVFFMILLALGWMVI